MRQSSLLCVLALLVSACGSSPAAPSSTTATAITPIITFSGPEVLAPGQAGQLTATELQSSGSTQNVTTAAQWSSSDASIATVSGTGVVNAVGVGAATITANYQGLSGTWVVSVTSTNTVSTVLVTGSASIGTKEGTQLTAIASLRGGDMQDVTTLATWQSSTPGVAAVSNTGIVTAVAPGTTTISARYVGVSGTWNVSVVDVPSAVVVFGPATMAAASTTPMQFTSAAVMSIGPERVVTNSAAWSSSDPGVATVSATGQVTSVAAGTTTISATYNGVTGSVLLTVD